MNRRLGEGGQRIEPLGSDALQRWIETNGVQERDGAYWQRTILPSGQVALVEVQPPPEVLNAELMGNAEISQMIMRTLEGETRSWGEGCARRVFLQDFKAGVTDFEPLNSVAS